MVSKDDAERYVSGVKTEVAIARIRERVSATTIDFSRRGLPFTTVSERVPGVELFVVRPAGVLDDDLAPESMLLCDLDGAIVSSTPGSDGDRLRDVDLHAAVLRHVEDAGCLVQVQSGFVSAWATRGEAVPCATTLAADEFGGAVPVIDAPIDDERALAAALVRALRPDGGRAAIVPHLGAFCLGASAQEAARVALVLESTARTAWLAGTAGSVPAMTSDEISRRRSRADAAAP